MNFRKNFALSAVARGVAGVALVAAGVPAFAADTTAPGVSITGGDWRVVNQTYALTGLATDNVAVASVSYKNAANGATGAASLSGQTASASWAIENIAVKAGTNTVTVTVTDTAGNTKTAQKVITAAATTTNSGASSSGSTTTDTTAPAITITSGSWQVTNSLYQLSGTATDNVGVKSVHYYNTRTGLTAYATLGTAGGKSTTWALKDIKVLSGSNEVWIAVTDNNGNKTRITKFITAGTTTTAPAPAPAPTPAPAPAPTPAPAPAPTPAPAPAPTPAPAPAPSASALSPACSTFYATNFALSTAMTTDTVASLAKPAKGVTVTEPNYKTCLVRSTDHTADGISGFTRNDYSRRQAFNADSSQYIVYALNGSWQLYDTKTRNRVKALSGPAGDAEPQWSGADKDKLYYFPTNGVGMKVNELTVSTNTTKVLGDLSARIKAKWPTANAAWTKSEGSPSKDGRYWCMMVDDASWKSLGVVTWDRDTDTILGYMNTNGERPDHVSMSPSGNYCVVSGDGARGTVAYSRDFSTSKKLLSKSEHSDLAIDANGDDVYVSVDYQSSAGDVFMLNLRTGVRTTLFTTYVSGSATALHVSGKSFNKPGWVLLSTYGDYGGKQWLHKKMFAVQLSASPKIYNLGFTRAVENGYWTEPHATVNRDFTKVMFNSNWNVNSDTDVDAYMIELPAGAIK